jgi:hypothetical protein
MTQRPFERTWRHCVQCSVNWAGPLSEKKMVKVLFAALIELLDKVVPFRRVSTSYKNFNSVAIKICVSVSKGSTVLSIIHPRETRD